MNSTMKTLSRLLSVLLFSFALANAADYCAIAHPGNATAEVSREEAKGFLLGTKIKWNDGTVVKLVLLSEGTAADTSSQDLAARTADQLAKYWKKQVFTGKGVSPDYFKTDEEVVAFVAKTPGAFGIVATAPANGSVKVLSLK
jgi:hypothetical protein